MLTISTSEEENSSLPLYVHLIYFRDFMIIQHWDDTDINYNKKEDKRKTINIQHSESTTYTKICLDPS